MKRVMYTICLLLISGCVQTSKPLSGDWPENWDYIEATSGDEVSSSDAMKSATARLKNSTTKVKELQAKQEELQAERQNLVIRLIKLEIPESTITKPEKLQTKRRDMIVRLIREGIFDRIEMPGTLPRLWVGPSFMNLDFKTKSSFVEVVYAYYFDRPDRKQSEIWGDSVRIKDMFTGKEIGSYSLGNLGDSLNLK